MHLSTSSLFATVLAFVAFDQAAAICYWDTCCYTNHNGPGACPPQLWKVSLTASYCGVSICPVGCTNLKDGSACDCCDIATGACRTC
ncbi:hypothetical protein LY76DRAFT_516740 [Colletotrichum caudatum]|nr:hypothetical protein LY76DRAFT_516740 [Colletotrichum caudatum]